MQDHLVDERHYSSQDLAKLWNVSAQTIRKMFRNEPGVLRLGSNGDRRTLGYVSLKIPHSVAARVHARLSAVAKVR